MTASFAQVVLREWLMTPLVVGLALLPGLGGAALIARRLRLTWPEIVLTSFSLTIALTSAVALAAHVTGLRLDVVVVAYVVLAVASAVAFWLEWRRSRLGEPRRDGVGLALGAGAAVVALVERPWFRSSADTFYHLAASRSLLATGRPLVTDPFHGTAATALDPTSGVWHTVQAVLGRVLFADVAQLYAGVLALSAAMVVLGFWVLARRVGGTTGAATLATVAMAAVAYHFDFRVLAYPKHISEALLFFGLALLVRLLEEPAWPVLALAAVVGAATTAMHLAAAEFLFLAGGFMALGVAIAAAVASVRREPRWLPQLGMLAGTLGCVGVLSVPLLLPKLTALSGSSVMGSDSFLQLSDHVMKLGGLTLVKFGGMFTGGPLVFFPMLVLIAFALPRAAYDAKALAAVALMAMIPLLLNDPLVTPLALCYSSYMVMRMAALMRFLPFVGVAWAAGAVLPGRERLLPALAAAAVGLAVLGAAPDLFATATGIYPAGFARGLDVYGLGATYARDVRAIWGPDTLTKIRAVVGDEYPVVAADERTGYYLAGLEPVAIVATQGAHAPAAIDKVEGEERRVAMARFFSPDASRDERLAIIRRYHVRYVFVWKHSEEKQVFDDEAEPSLLRQSDLFATAVASPNVDLLRVIAR